MADEEKGEVEAEEAAEVQEEEEEEVAAAELRMVEKEDPKRANKIAKWASDRSN